MKVRVQIAAIVIILAAACTSLVTPTLAAEYTLKWAVVTRGDMQEKFGHKLAEILPKATNGRVEVKVFPGGQLGSPAAMIEGLQLGTIEGYENPADFFVGVDSRFGEFSIPFLFKSTDQANKVLGDPEFNAYVLNMAEAKGIVGVNLAVAAESLYFGAKKPLKSIEDFKGMKLRVAQPEQGEMEDEVAGFPQVATLGGQRAGTAGLLPLGDPPATQPSSGLRENLLGSGSGLSASVVRQPAQVSRGGHRSVGAGPRPLLRPGHAAPCGSHRASGKRRQPRRAGKGRIPRGGSVAPLPRSRQGLARPFTGGHHRRRGLRIGDLDPGAGRARQLAVMRRHRAR